MRMTTFKEKSWLEVHGLVYTDGFTIDVLKTKQDRG